MAASVNQNSMRLFSLRVLVRNEFFDQVRSKTLLSFFSKESLRIITNIEGMSG
jgi:hypothetical protein